MVVEEFAGKVVGVTDGDTIRVLTDDLQALVVRLDGIDAPEKAQEHGRKAEAALHDLVHGRRVTVRKTGTDKYRRTLALVVAEGLDVNAWLVEHGWAWQYLKYNCEERLAKLENEARGAKRGLWQHPRPMPPWEFRQLKKTPLEDRGPVIVPGPRSSAKADGSGRNAPPTRASPPPAREPVSPAVVARFWLNTSSGVRHNAGCKHFGNTKAGRPCGPGEGRACGICGG